MNPEGMMTDSLYRSIGHLKLKGCHAYFRNQSNLCHIKNIVPIIPRYQEYQGSIMVPPTSIGFSFIQ